MPSSASQYPRDFTTRAETGSNVAGSPPQNTSYNRQVDDGISNIYGQDWKEPELQDPSRVYRESAKARSFPSASTGGYLYPRTLDIPPVQSPEGHNSRGSTSTATNDPNGRAQYARPGPSAHQPGRRRGQP
jgi:hypothetical protein